ncbi:hypothetical protein BH20ACT3_BH20ACT3_08220 [soil metagenome]
MRWLPTLSQRPWRGLAASGLRRQPLGTPIDTSVAIWPIYGRIAASGIVVIVRINETHLRHGRIAVPVDTDLES